jgi:hypothetical protein
MRYAIRTGAGTASKFLSTAKGRPQMIADMYSADTFDTEAEATERIASLPLPIRNSNPQVIQIQHRFKP